MVSRDGTLAVSYIFMKLVAPILLLAALAYVPFHQSIFQTRENSINHFEKSGSSHDRDGINLDFPETILLAAFLAVLFGALRKKHSPGTV